MHNGLWDRLVSARCSALGLAVFRIAYGLVLLGQVGQMLYFHRLIFDPVAYVIRSENQLEFALAAWLVAISCLVLGWQTRAACTVNYVLSLVTFSTFDSFEYHVDHIFIGVNFLLLWIPVSRRLSLDAVLTAKHNMSAVAVDQSVPVFYYHALLVLGVGLVYFDSFFWKIDQQIWREGLGVWLPMSLPHDTWLSPELLTPLLNCRELMVAVNYATLALEASFLFLMWFRSTRLLLLVVGGLLHIGIFFAFPIPWFALTMLALYVLLIPPEWLERLLQWAQRGSHRPERFFVGESARDSIATDVSFRPIEAGLGDRLGMRVAVAVVLLATGIQSWLIAGTPSVSAITGSSLPRMGRTLQECAHGFLGLCSHGVFIDHHFEGYDHLIAVAYVHSDGRLDWLPMTQPDGQAGWYATGRQWAKWGFRGCGPYLCPQVLSRTLQQFTAFWAHKNEVDLKNAQFRILVKKYDACEGWEPDYLKRQCEKPWLPAGNVQWNQGQFAYLVDDIERM